MYKRSTSLLVLALVSCLAALGCGDNSQYRPTPAEVRARISRDLGNVLREARAAFTIDLEAVPDARANAIVERLLDMGGLGPDHRAMAARLVAQGSRMLPAIGRAMADEDAVIAFLNDEVFTDANYLGNGLYQIPPSLICSENDTTCADVIAKARPRIRTATEDDALVCAIRIDAFDEEPVSFRLTHTSLANTVDLDEMQHTLVTLASLTDVGPLNVALSGQSTGKLEILGPAQAKTSLTFDRALSIRIAPAGVDLNSDEAFSVSSAEAEVFSLAADGTAKTGSLAVGLGPTVVKIFDSDADKRLELDLPGATLNAAYAQDEPIQLAGVGLGDRSTSFLVNGARAVTIDLNPDDRRAFDATVSRDPVTNAVAITVAPRLDLRIAIDHAALGDERPVYDVTRVLLEGGLRTTEASDQIEVVTGSFSVATDPASYGFTATAGQCVMSREESDPNTQQPFTRWTVGACR